MRNLAWNAMGNAALSMSRPVRSGKSRAAPEAASTTQGDEQYRHAIDAKREDLDDSGGRSVEKRTFESVRLRALGPVGASTHTVQKQTGVLGRRDGDDRLACRCRLRSGRLEY